MSESSLYRPLARTVEGDRLIETFAATEHVGSPWGPMQHGGPVAALLARAMDRHDPRPGCRTSRVTIDLLGPVPVGEVRVSARTERPGRRIALIQAILEARDRDGTWRPYAHGSAWRLATQRTHDVIHRGDSSQRPPDPSAGTVHDHRIPDAWRLGGFVGAVEWRVAQLGTRAGVPTVAWVNLTRALIEGEQTSDLERLIALADTANGVGARLDPARFTFLNTEMTVHLHHPPSGQWYGLEAETSIGPDGIGTSSGVLHAEAGPIGRVTQNLLVERLPEHDRR
ncbi:thioesterase family protein [Pseudonocardia hispaniensis]|uniref:Thioesterase family protein n=1 Tax=Pseudonocardia hispaniensis TaxID=904933 RepID=A0ABW1IZ49_9PSEU